MKIEDFLTGLRKEWRQYSKDPEVLSHYFPGQKYVLSFEGFWIWLMKRPDKKKSNSKFMKEKWDNCKEHGYKNLSEFKNK
jgi:hypothetical protein